MKCPNIKRLQKLIDKKLLSKEALEPVDQEPLFDFALLRVEDITDPKSFMD